MPSYTAAEKENALRLSDEIGVSKASKETGISPHTLYKWRAGTDNGIATDTADGDETPVEETASEVRHISPNRKRYTAAEKEKALRLCDEIGIIKASKETGITTNSLYKWRTEAQNKSSTTIATVDESPAKEAITAQNDAQADNESSTDIISRLAKTPSEETVDSKETQSNLHNATVDEVPSKELIQLRIENASLKAQMATLKNALRVFTE